MSLASHSVIPRDSAHDDSLAPSPGLTEQRTVEDALRASEARYRTLCESAPVGVFQTDPTGAVTYFNRRMLQLWGAADAQELLGHRWLSLVCQADREPLRAAWTAALNASREFAYEYRIVTPDGTERCVRGQATPLLDEAGVRTGTVGTVEDITERKQTEDDLRRQATTFAMLNDGVILTDMQGHVVDWNPAAERIFGHTRAAMLGRSAERIYASDIAIEQHAEIRDALRSVGRWEGESRFIRPDGTEGVCETSVVVLRDAGGVPIGGIGVNRDVTERKRAEAALRESQERYRRVVETAHEGICTVDAAGTVTYANDCLLSMLGCGDALGRQLFEFMDDDTAFAARTSFARRFRGIAEPSDVPIRRQDGSTIWCCYSASAIVTDDGTFRGAVYMLNDITEQHAAGRRLADSERHFRALTEQSSELVSVLNAQGTIRYGNPAYSRTLGYSPEEVLGRPALEFVHPEDLPEIGGIFTRLVALAGDVVHAEYRARHRDGSWRTLRTVAQNLLADPAVKGIVINSHDITASRTAEELGRQQREMLGTIFDHIPAMVTLTDPSGCPVFANREWTRISGWRVDELSGGALFEQLYPDADVRARMHEFMRAPGGMPGAFRMRVRDGRVLETVWTAVALSDGSVIGMGQDVTDRCQLEEQLRQAQKMEAVGSLAGGVAHDFNNLLTVIMSYAMVLLAELPADDPMCADIREIQAAADRAASLTRQLLAFSRQQVLDPRVIDLRQVVTGMEGMLRRLIGEDIELAFAGGGHPVHVLADAGQIEQVVMNLVVNARDAMPAGGHLAIGIEETVVASTEEGAPGVASHRGIAPGRYLRLRVRDTGHGMSASTRARVFDPFFTTKEAGKGTGLGLATVYGIVKQSGGYIHVESAPGEGTLFEIHLPCVTPDEAAAGAVSSAIVLPERRGATVLVVEDQGSLLAIIQRLLEKRGYHVLTAADGAEALDVAERHGRRVQLLLTDVVMPKGSGQELAQRLSARWGEIPVLFMTGYSMGAVTNHGVLWPGAQLLKKPFTPQDLARAVSEVLHVPT